LGAQGPELRGPESPRYGDSRPPQAQEAQGPREVGTRIAAAKHFCTEQQRSYLLARKQAGRFYIINAHFNIKVAIMLHAESCGN